MEFTLRKFKDIDVLPIFHYGSNPKIAQNMRNAFPDPYTLKDAAEFVTNALNDKEIKQCLRAIEIDGKAVGSIGVFLKEDVYQKCAHIGYWLGEDYWNHHIMSRAIAQMCDYVFANYDVVRIEAEVFAYNTASIRALLNAGFQKEGILEKRVFKNGQIYDECLLARLK